MQCPTCAVEMDEVRKLDIIVDSCSRCGGIWLDRGELDKLRSAAEEFRQEARSHRSSPQELSDVMRKVEQLGHAARSHGKHKRKKSVFDLLEIFD